MNTQSRQGAFELMNSFMGMMTTPVSGMRDSTGQFAQPSLLTPSDRVTPEVAQAWSAAVATTPTREPRGSATPGDHRSGRQ
ncbi:hypothetical protein [Methyloligella halotolerans]|uniref:hypothetical protein n=1 Tax=Methyloligella halotolerans TaxID=1177755 RepID=UPI00083DC69B|nr:hypothetical protein [Methyloligella halotolerans]